MTYCVGMLLDEGLVMAADTRTNAGVDNVGKFKKLHTWQKPGECLFVLLTAGNLAVTQAVVSLLTEGTKSKKGKSADENLFAAKTMFQAVRIVGRAIREVKKIEGEALSPPATPLLRATSSRGKSARSGRACSSSMPRAISLRRLLIHRSSRSASTSMASPSWTGWRRHR
ncbi:MAG TPA: hypothetical protein PLK44_05745 [Aestuariivirga sp.]|nr:hypothetical protein [Aestuariivirga sp.]